MEDVFPKKISKRLAKAYFRFSVSKSAIRFRMEQAFTRLKDCTAYLSLSVERVTYTFGRCINDVEQIINEVQDLTTEEGRGCFLLHLLDRFHKILVVI